MGIKSSVEDDTTSLSYSGIEIPKDIKISQFLREHIGGCTKCTLSNSRMNIVYYRGNPRSKILVVGEA